jgi:hypothetical protein
MSSDRLLASYYLSLQGGLKFKALRGKESAVRAPQLPPRGCNVEHFSQNGFRTVFCEVMGWHFSFYDI